MATCIAIEFTIAVVPATMGIKKLIKWAAKKIAKAAALSAITATCKAIEGAKGGREVAINALKIGGSTIGKMIGVSGEIVVYCLKIINEFIKLLRRKTSLRECVSNIIVITSETGYSIIFGIAGSILGRIVGGAIGTFILPGIGTTIGCFAGAIIGGYVGRKGGEIVGRRIGNLTKMIADIPAN